MYTHLVDLQSLSCSFPLICLVFSFPFALAYSPDRPERPDTAVYFLFLSFELQPAHLVSHDLFWGPLGGDNIYVAACTSVGTS